MRLASIHIYPMKAGRAVDLDESPVEPWGLAGDRRWLLVDEDGRFISQREEPSLARVVVRHTPAASATSATAAQDISVSADSRPGRIIAVPAPGAPLLKVSVWSSTLLAAAAGPEADAWFSAYLGRPVRLVYLDDPTRRAVDPDYGRSGDVVSFADGWKRFTVLVALVVTAMPEKSAFGLKVQVVVLVVGSGSPGCTVRTTSISTVPCGPKEPPAPRPLTVIPMPSTVTITALTSGKARLQRLLMPPKRSISERAPPPTRLRPTS